MIVLGRHKYILQQIHTLNENVAADTARSGIRGLLVLMALIGGFTILLVAIGVLSWIDYRREESFMIGVTVLLWILGESVLIPRVA